MEDNERAGQNTQAATDAAIANRVRYSGTSATHCDDCAEPIPQRRRESIAGCRRCCECQRMVDRRSATCR